MTDRLKGKRAVVTECHDFMGPDIVSLFREEGAEVIADDRDLTKPSAAGDLLQEAGRTDILIVNLSIPNPRALAHETTDEQWASVFDKIVHAENATIARQSAGRMGTAEYVDGVRRATPADIGTIGD